MENRTIGLAKGGSDVSEPQPDPEIRRERFRNYRFSEIADSEQFGSVVGRIYANETHAGEIIFKLEVIRIYCMSSGSGEAFNYEFGEILDGIRCLKWAYGWMWRGYRQLRRTNGHRFWR